MPEDPSALEGPPMYGLFQAIVPTCEGEKIGGCNFDHEPNDFEMRKKKKKKNLWNIVFKKKNAPIFGF